MGLEKEKLTRGTVGRGDHMVGSLYQIYITANAAQGLSSDLPVRGFAPLWIGTDGGRRSRSFENLFFSL